MLRINLIINRTHPLPFVPVIPLACPVFFSNFVQIKKQIINIGVFCDNLCINVYGHCLTTVLCNICHGGGSSSGIQNSLCVRAFSITCCASNTHKHVFFYLQTHLHINYESMLKSYLLLCTTFSLIMASPKPL